MRRVRPAAGPSTIPPSPSPTGMRRHPNSTAYVGMESERTPGPRHVHVEPRIPAANDRVPSDRLDRSLDPLSRIDSESRTLRTSPHETRGDEEGPEWRSAQPRRHLDETRVRHVVQIEEPDRLDRMPDTEALHSDVACFARCSAVLLPGDHRRVEPVVARPRLGDRRESPKRATSRGEVDRADRW